MLGCMGQEAEVQAALVEFCEHQEPWRGTGQKDLLISHKLQ
jgi:hypothetical protein